MMPSSTSSMVPSSEEDAPADEASAAAEEFAESSSALDLRISPSFSSSTNADPLSEIAAAFRAGVEVKNRRHHLKTYPQCFVGTAAVDYLLSHGDCASRTDAVMLGQSLMDGLHLFEHVTRDHPFADQNFFYRFVDESERGAVKINDATGQKFAWSDYLSSSSSSGNNSNPMMTTTAQTRGGHDNRLPKFPAPDLANVSRKDAHVASRVWPLDEHNTLLLNNVHPAEWQDPKPNIGPNASHYDLVVIGGGAVRGKQAKSGCVCCCCHVIVSNAERIVPLYLSIHIEKTNNTGRSRHRLGCGGCRCQGGLDRRTLARW
jgi:Domain found in Dishevelled, Egl-10, and Pleckstrin (DEP)